MARPGNYALALYRGDSYTWQFVLWEDDAHTIESDLTGVVAAAQIRDKPGGAIVLSMTCDITLPNIIDLTLPAAAWSPSSPKGNAAWDLQLTYDDDQVITILAGAAVITVDVTT